MNSHTDAAACPDAFKFIRGGDVFGMDYEDIDVWGQSSCEKSFCKEILLSKRTANEIVNTQGDGRKVLDLVKNALEIARRGGTHSNEPNGDVPASSLLQQRSISVDMLQGSGTGFHDTFTDLVTRENAIEGLLSPERTSQSPSCEERKMVCPKSASMAPVPRLSIDRRTPVDTQRKSLVETHQIDAGRSRRARRRVALPAGRGADTPRRASFLWDRRAT